MIAMPLIRAENCLSEWYISKFCIIACLGEKAGKYSGGLRWRITRYNIWFYKIKRQDAEMIFQGLFFS